MSFLIMFISFITAECATDETDGPFVCRCGCGCNDSLRSVNKEVIGTAELRMPGGCWEQGDEIWPGELGLENWRSK